MPDFKQRLCDVGTRSRVRLLTIRQARARLSVPVTLSDLSPIPLQTPLHRELRAPLWFLQYAFSGPREKAYNPKSFVEPCCPLALSLRIGEPGEEFQRGNTTTLSSNSQAVFRLSR